MLGLAETLQPDVNSTFIVFKENGRYREFLKEVQRAGFSGHVLSHDTPRLPSALGELVLILRTGRADVLVCHSTKPNLLGLLAARRVGIPAISVSRGWTGENFKVRIYDALDRRVLRWMDRVVCVSEGQAAKGAPGRRSRRQDHGDSQRRASRAIRQPRSRGAASNFCGCSQMETESKRGQSPFVRSTRRAVPANGDCPLFHPRSPTSSWARPGDLVPKRGSAC